MQSDCFLQSISYVISEKITPGFHLFSKRITMIILIWIISLIVLIATIVFVYRMLVTSNEFIATDKVFPFKFLKAGAGRDKFYRKSLTVLNAKIKSLEDSNAYYEIQFSRLQSRMSNTKDGASEISSLENIPSSTEEEEEDWKELYYQENESKVQLENDLDETLQNLEAANQEMAVLKEKTQKTATLNSTLDARLIELSSMQKEIEVLEKKLMGGKEREKELQVLLDREIALKTVYDKIENDNVRLRSESEDLKRQLTEMNQKEAEAARQLIRIRELQSHAGLYEEEKNRKIVELNNKMEKNKVFSQ